MHISSGKMNCLKFWGKQAEFFKFSDINFDLAHQFWGNLFYRLNTPGYIGARMSMPPFFSVQTSDITWLPTYEEYLNKLALSMLQDWGGFWFFFETKSQYVVQAGHELAIPLPWPPESWSWNYRPACPVLLQDILLTTQRDWGCSSLQSAWSLGFDPQHGESRGRKKEKGKEIQKYIHAVLLTDKKASECESIFICRKKGKLHVCRFVVYCYEGEKIRNDHSKLLIFFEQEMAKG